jgi:apolipoprotein N-acyltransferase
MPATTKSKKRQKKVAPSKKPANQPKLATSVSLVLAAISGAILGLSAPGIGAWYLAWVGLVPLLLLTVSADGVKQAMLRGLVFGLGYNLIYLNWYLQLHPLDWLGFSFIESAAVAAAAWVAVSTHQAIIVALICGLLRWLPLTGGFLPRQVEQKWCLPALLVIPALWVLMENKIANAPDLLGVPWTMLEYSQYQQLPIIQAASWIGGIGIGFVIVMANVSLAILVATFSQRLSLKSLASGAQNSAITQALTVALCIVSLYAWGLSRVGAPRSGDSETLSVVQGNINIEMQKAELKKIAPDDMLSYLLSHYSKLIEKCPPGMVVWTESALPAYLKNESGALDLLADLSKKQRVDMVIGSIDRDFDGHPYNSAFGIASDGKLLGNVYHKRYLVPFGEYMPSFVKYFPEWMQRLTNTPAGTGFNAGKMPVVLSINGKDVAPLICFETLSPELVAASVRSGGELLVNLSDLAWFHRSACGEQMTAFSVLRAVENDRYFVFAANTGPSVIIDPAGRITAASQSGKETVLTGKVRFSSEFTPFTRWFN